MAARRRNCERIIVSEEFRIQSELVIKNFVQSENFTYEFSATLTHAERAWIHNYVKKYGLRSRSYGCEPNRTLLISKPKTDTNQDIISFTIGKDNQKLLTTFRRKFPTIRDMADVQLFQSRMNHLENKDISMGQLTSGCPQLPSFSINNELLNFRMNLPIWAMKNYIINEIVTNQVTVIRGDTGSGKTTQIPQFILDYSASCGEKCRIICTQPRRISAITVAERVADERGEKPGQSVGYHIRLESCVGPKTTLIYCTNGILLRTLMSGDHCLESYTHIIVDEIHERDRYSDFLLICLRECLSNFPHLRLILMSATIDENIFINYFGGAPILHIPGKTYLVSKLYLEDILLYLNYESPAMKLNNTKTPEEQKIVTKNFVQDRDNLSPRLQLEVEDTIKECFGTGTDELFNEFLQLHLNDGVPVNYQHSQSGYTALMAAAYHGRLDICFNLVSFGANVNIQSYEEKFTAIDWASFKHYFDIVEFLRKWAVGTGNDTVEVHQEEKKKFLLDLYHKTVSDNNIDFDLLHNLLYYIHTELDAGSILVFLTGYDDIVTIKERIFNDVRFGTYAYEIFTLHGMMQISDQHRVFSSLKGKRKIILSTNIAESSITIDDVVYVIDCGKVKEKVYDSMTGICTLQSCWISQSSSMQRAGRAGRTQNGMFFQLYSKYRYRSMSQFATPEMLRMPLHELCLQTKLLAPNETKIADFLSRAMEPPSPVSVCNAIKHLQEIGALDEDEHLTTLGQHLVDLPLEPHLAKMLIYSVIFKCIDPILTIVAFLSYRDPFVLPTAPHEKNFASTLRKKYSGHTFSDHMILLKAFQAWQEARVIGRDAIFCSENFISGATMEMVVKIRSQLLAQLRAIGFVNTKPPGDIRELNENSNNWAMVKAVLTSGLFPNIAFVNKETSQISTRKEKKVLLNLSSSIRNFERNNNHGDSIQCLKRIPTNWLMYEELSRCNNTHNIRSVTAVTDVTVALFTNLSLSEEMGEDDSDIFDANNWISFDLSGESLKDIIACRAKLSYLITKKLVFPHKQFSIHDSNLLQVIANVLQLEDISRGLIQPEGIGQRPRIMNCNHESTNNIRRFNYHQRTEKEEELITRFIRFNRVNADYYNRFDKDFKPQENECSSAGNQVVLVQNLLENFNFPQVHPEQCYLETDDFAQNGVTVEQEEGACALVPCYEPPFWEQQLYDPNLTSFCIIKTGTLKAIDISICKKGWVLPPYTEKKVKMVFQSGKTVYLIFSAQNTQSFHGLARLIKIPDPKDNNYSIQSILEWISRADVKFDDVKEYFPQQYHDGDEINHDLGIILWKLFNTYCPPAPPSVEPTEFVGGRAITKRR